MVDNIIVAIMVLLHFYRDKLRHFRLCNFLFDAGQHARFSLLTYLRLTQFSHARIGNFPDDFIPWNKICNFDTPRLATFMTILCFLSSDVIFTA